MTDQPKPQGPAPPAQGGAQDQPGGGRQPPTVEPPPEPQPEPIPARREGVVCNPDPESIR